MRFGDRVIVIDPTSRREGVSGTLIETTPTGDLVIRFEDGDREVMNPFQVESEGALAPAPPAPTIRAREPMVYSHA